MSGRNKGILIVDDAELNREILNAMFEGKYEVHLAADGQEAIEFIDENANMLSLILLDLIMPRKSGLEVLAHMKHRGLCEKIPVIVITGETAEDSDIKAYEYGAADIIHKPFSSEIVTRRAHNLIEQYESRHNIEQQLEERTSALREKTKALELYQKKIEETNTFLINALSSVIAFRSTESGEHIERVKVFTGILLRHWMMLYPESGFSEADIELMVNASALHDIGKIAIPDKILNKPAKLTDEEFMQMRTHTTLGCQILENFKQENNDFYRYCYDICRYHHERYNGKGYPDGLVGDEIPIWAQVVSVVDVYDALISPRVYKRPFPVNEALRMIHAGESGVFSPKLLACLDHATKDLIAATNVVSMVE